jgi:hypothetical protein
VKPETVGITVIFSPKSLNLDWWNLHLVYIFSKVSLRFFYAKRRLKDTNWEKQESSDVLAWQTAEVPLKEREAIAGWVNELLEEFEKAVIEDVKNRVLLKSEASLGENAEADSKSE